MSEAGILDLLECLRHESEFLAQGGYYSQAKLIDEAVDTIIGLQQALELTAGLAMLPFDGISTPRALL